jgi:thiamine pyrophosphate-dependent acetolactate synthase large subunit-like protein
MAGAKRPVVIVGHGARAGVDDVVLLAEMLHAPIATTFKAKGLIPDDHPLAAGVLGRSGTPVASWLMNESDLLLVFGASFANHTGIAPYKPIVQVDSEQAALGRFHPVTVPVFGDIAVSARRFARELGAASGLDAIDQRDDVAARRAIWQDEKTRRTTDDRGHGVASAALFAALSHHAPADAVIAVDVGNNTYSFGRYFECKRQSVLMSGYLGSIGFGYPAAMGAWAAAPERPIVAVTGDGGFGQYLAELNTAVKYDMAITHVLLNNCQLGKITKEQRAAEWDVWQTSLHNPNFAEYAGICGAHGERVSTSGELDDALGRAFAHDGPSLVEVMTDPDLV